jgi:hypothetical protein
MELQLRKSLNDVWETHYVFGYPFGIEMSTRVCEYCFDYFATSSDIVAHYKTAHKEEEE